MKRIAGKFTYANVTATLALFLVLAGGTAFAASKLAKNSVGTKQLKKSSVTAAKLKKNSVVTAKIKNDSVTGAKVDAATLGTVPSATTAATFAGYSRKGMTRVPATAASGFKTGLETAPQTLLLTAGPLTIYAQCFTHGPGIDGVISIKTSLNGVVFSSDDDQAGGDPAYLDTNTEAEERELLATDTGFGGASFSGGGGNEFAAMAPDGTTVSGDLQIGVKAGTPPGGNGIYGEGNACLFAGEMTTLSG